MEDDKTWEVLEMIEMRQVLSELPQGLDTQSEGGSNFSCGQRFLFY
jgi:ABC-type multidrug transport system fused ATPase/permease subunit